MKLIILGISLLCIMAYAFAVSVRKNGKSRNTRKNLAWKSNNNKPISSVIDTVEYTILEEHPEIPLMCIDKLIVKNDKYYVFDHSGPTRVFVYDIFGNFLFNVGHQGEGFGEYSCIRNFTTDGNYIYLLNDSRNSLMTYGADGLFINEKKLPFTAVDLAIAGNGDFLFSWSPGMDDSREENYRLIVTDQEISIKERYFQIRTDEYQEQPKQNFLTTTDTVILFHTQYSDSIALFNRQTAEFMNIINISFQEEVSRPDQKAEKRNLYSYRYLQDTPGILSHYLIGNTCENGELRTYVYNMVTQEAHYNRHEDADYLSLPHAYYNEQIISCPSPSQFYEDIIRQKVVDVPDDICQRVKDGEHILITYTLK